MSSTARQIAEACKPIVVETARKRSTIGYGKLARRIRSKVSLPGLDGHDRRLHDALDVLSKDSYDEGQNLLLSVVVVKEEDGMPGHGFFHLAREVLGAYPVEASEMEIFVEELNKIHALYGKPSKASYKRPTESTN